MKIVTIYRRCTKVQDIVRTWPVGKRAKVKEKHPTNISISTRLSSGLQLSCVFCCICVCVCACVLLPNTNNPNISVCNTNTVLLCWIRPKLCGQSHERVQLDLEIIFLLRNNIGNFCRYYVVYQRLAFERNSFQNN